MEERSVAKAFLQKPFCSQNQVSSILRQHNLTLEKVFKSTISNQITQKVGSVNDNSLVLLFRRLNPSLWPARRILLRLLNDGDDCNFMEVTEEDEKRQQSWTNRSLQRLAFSRKGAPNDDRYPKMSKGCQT